MGGVAQQREGRSVCAHASVSGVCRGGQGNKSEQRGVMRFGWSTAVINTMLGSNTGHTFGSGWLGEHNHTLSIIPVFLFSDPSFIYLKLPLLFFFSSSHFLSSIFHSFLLHYLLIPANIFPCLASFFVHHTLSFISSLHFIPISLPPHPASFSFLPRCFLRFLLSFFSLIQAFPLSFRFPHRHRPLSLSLSLSTGCLCRRRFVSRHGSALSNLSC